MLKKDTDLAVRFAKPLPEIKIMANMSYGKEYLPTNDSGMATAGKKLMTGMQGGKFRIKYGCNGLKLDRYVFLINERSVSLYRGRRK